MQRPRSLEILSLVHTICISVSWGFLLACCITSPALRYSGFLYYNNKYHQYSFGVFGYCNNYLRSNACISKVGYDVYGIFQTADSEGGHSTPLPITYSYLTKYLILIPIALVVVFAASLVSLIQRRRGQILFSTATMSAVAFCFVLPSLVMEELLFNQLHKSVSTKDGAVVSWGIPRYLLIITVITTFVAAISGFIAARMALADKGKGHYATLQHPMPLAPYSNLDKQYGQGGVRERDPDAPYDPVGTHDAFSMVPSPTGSPAPGQQGQQGQYANPYDRERY